VIICADSLRTTNLYRSLMTFETFGGRLVVNNILSIPIEAVQQCSLLSGHENFSRPRSIFSILTTLTSQLKYGRHGTENRRFPDDNIHIKYENIIVTKLRYGAPNYHDVCEPVVVHRLVPILIII
jgi:hypothetical protein